MPKKNVIKKTTLSPTVLIAGGAGFIGSHLADVFLVNGARVVVLDDFRSGRDLYVKELLLNQNFALFDADINNGLPEQIESVDYVIHLAGLEEYLYSKEITDLRSLLTSSIGTKNLLDFSIKSKAKFLLISSTDVYQGRMSQIDLKDYFGKTTMDENKYALTEAKRYAEALVWEYYKKNDLDARIVRLPEVFGPRMNLDSSGALGGFMKDLIEGRNITVYGDGDIKAYYLYISDVVSGIVKSLFNPGTKGSIYSLAYGEPSTDVELAYLVKSLADHELPVDFKPFPEGRDTKPVFNKPDLFNLTELQWQPKISIKEGVTHTLEWFGYHPNEHSFKPAKLIFNKKKEEATPPPPIPQDMLFSLQGLKDDTPGSQENWPTGVNSGPNSGSNAVTKAVPKNESIKKAYLKEKISSLFRKKVKKDSVPVLNSTNLILNQRPPVADNSPLGKFGSFIRKNGMLISGFLAAFFAAVLIFLVVPLGLTYVNFKNGQKALENTIKMAGSLDSAGIRTEARTAYKSFYNARKSLSAFKWIFTLSNNKNLFDSSIKTVGSAVYFSKATYTLADAVKPFDSLWEVIRPDTAQDMDVKLFEEARSKISEAKYDIQMAQADLNFVNVGAFPKEIQPKLVAYKQGILDIAQALEVAEPVLSYLPNTLGADGPKIYMILFQNNNEVRPTGGFLGSYGLLTLEKGKIKSLDIDDIYNPDGQIDLRNITVAAPKQFETYLNEKKMHLRNANWNPDFPTSANDIADLFFKVSGERIDGVIAVDLVFVQNLLKATGPIFLTAYNEEITADNLYERTQFHCDYNYTNGSEQKKSFLTVLGSKLIERIFSTDKENLSALTGAMYNSLNERHLLISFENNPISTILAANKWDGGLVKNDGDYLNIVNANLGGTKSDYFVENKYSYKISSQTRDGLQRAELTLEYKHTGKDSAWPGGPYTDYLRIMTKQGVRLTGATAKFSTIDSADDIMKQVEVYNEGSFSVFAFGFKLDPASVLTIKINYDLPVDLSITKDNKEYSLYWQKQSGVERDPGEFIFEKPFGMELAEYTKGFVFDKEQIKYQTDLSTDRYFYVKLQ